ncbi:MAG TPA: transporter [Candidatus Paceibacterota bacterium]|nr:transporter [Verrucomicrobiota bacterium]HSA09127.1 transporter [Candidatus Paceibacterota bacterium]
MTNQTNPIKLSLITLVFTLTAATALAQNNAGSFYRPLTLQTADTGSGAGAVSDAEDQQAKAAALAKATLNPIASLISVPIQNNFDWGAGPADDGFEYKVTVQPVIPISLNENWNVISRTILPFIHRENYSGPGTRSGLADTTQSLFFSPVKPGPGGWIWGAGPVLQIPTATDDLLGEEKWGAGPTAVVLKQQGPWTYGTLFNHVWSFAGEERRADVNRTFLQPFVSYTTKTFTSIGLNTESTYDWQRSQWTVPVNLFVQQLLKVGKQPISLQVGGRYYAEGPSGAPEWGLRFQISFLFPK